MTLEWWTKDGVSSPCGVCGPTAACRHRGWEESYLLFTEPLPSKAPQAYVGPSFCFLDFKWKIKSGGVDSCPHYRPEVSPSSETQWQNWKADAIRACICLVHLPGPKKSPGTVPATDRISNMEKRIPVLLSSGMASPKR